MVECGSEHIHICLCVCARMSAFLVNFYKSSLCFQYKGREKYLAITKFILTISLTVAIEYYLRENFSERESIKYIYKHTVESILIQT